MAWRRQSDKPLSELMMVIYWRIYVSLGPNELNTKSSAWHTLVSWFIHEHVELYLSVTPVSYSEQKLIDPLKHN